VIPTHHRGVFAIEDKAHGGRPEADSRGIVLRIPPDGVLKCKDTDFLVQWHTTTAQYSDGSHLAYALEEGNGVSCWALFSTEDTQYYYVGDMKEKRVVAEQTVVGLKKYMLHETP
jgi:hypothetical protein